MDIKTTEIRYQQWTEIIRAWSSSGITKRAYCQANGISEKQFYYYQHRIRSILADQVENHLLPISDKAEAPQIVRLSLPGAASAQSAMISFSINGKCLSVPENISEAFLSKLLKAASHDSF